MAGTTNDTSSIDPQNSGFPPYLDFDQMRTNAITYLGPITGNYWTDYNVHDPGITTLEVLIYAIMDLGYRTHLPFGSLLAGPAGPGGATMAAPAFFTAGQSFGDNPLTILDYRKLLMDLAEVRNAWLKPEPDPTPYNGLYHVDLELAKDAADFPDTPAFNAYKAEVGRQVRNRLRAHRNLCEDVQDIKVLDKQLIGVRADLEVVPGTDIATAYQGVVAALYTFFSPVPTYYTLGQLTAKQVSPDTIFRGRPYSKGPSHGFLLDQEMPAGPGNDRNIRLSDVYQAILAVSGLQTIRSLQLLDKDGQPLKLEQKEWMTSLPSGNIPAFLLSASSFRWFSNNQLLTTDLSAYNASLERNGRYSNKILYAAGSAALDAGAPPAMTLPGLADYQSVQNDYPLVYGIGPGGLPPGVSTLRQSQALQFKAFLLFFDQLFADYVAQLANLRQIFSMSAPSGGSTYFHGDLSSVPGLAGLLRFPPAAAGAAGGTTLLIPVAVKTWEQLQNDPCSQPSGQTPSSTENKSTDPRYPPGATPARKATGSIPGIFHPTGHGAAPIRVTTLPGPGQISSVRADAIQSYYFPTAIARDTALATTAVLFGGNPPAAETMMQDDGRWRYYFNKINPDYLLLSRNSFSTQADALGEAATALYIGQNTTNYARLSLGDVSQYSFSLASSTQSYYDYLQDILEDKQRFTERRTQFLTHLLARFGEAFTDYALLEAGIASAGQIATGQIDGMQNFLTRWPALSGNRGTAVGLEQRIYTYCGIPETRNSIFCHFEVYRGDEWFQLAINVKEEALFTCPGGFSGKQALPAVKGLLRTLADRSAYRVVMDEQTGDYGLEVTLYGQYIARSTSRWLDAPTAERAADAGFRLFQREPSKDDIVETASECFPRLFNSAEQVVRVGKQGFPNAVEAVEAGYLLLKDIDKKKFWTQVDPTPLGKLRHNQYPGLPAEEIIAVDNFDISARQDVLGVGKEDRWSFEMLDKGHRFRFRSTGDYETKTEADEAGFQLLHFLAKAKHYSLRRVRGEIRVVIRVDDIDWAEGEPTWEDETSAREWMNGIVHQVQRHRYYLHVKCEAIRWRWLFFFGLPGQELVEFRSIGDYTSPEKAADAAREFYHRGPRWDLRDTGRGLELAGTLETEETDLARAARLLAFREAAWALSAGDERAQRHCLIPIEPTLKGAWLYRLVDKEYPRAFHPFERHSRQEAEELRDQLIVRECDGYRFVEFCLGGDNIRLDPSANYHYLLRCRNDYFARLGVICPDSELVLFESGEHYLTETDAQDDFQKNYFKLLDLAGDAGNYGEGRPIRLAGAEGGDHPPLLVVPAATRDALIAAGLEVVDTLVKAVWTYPFREERHHPRDGAPAEPPQYYFVLGSDWKSANNFSSPGLAQEAFNDFLFLLEYSGNYFIDFEWTVYAYRVGIREVLLESCTRFPDEAEAWGKEGVERCIGVAQTKGGFHLLQRADCSYTYCVACPNPLAVHPCTYDNAARRDKALAALRQHPGYFLPHGWVEGPAPTHHRFKLLDGLGHPVAWVPLPDPASQDAIINRILDIIAALDRGARPQPFGDSWQLIVGEGAKAFAIEEVEEEPAHLWMRKLNDVADYFPVTRDTPLPGHYEAATYLLVIKLPGFSDPVISPSALRDCGCPPDPGGDNCCYAAWVGRAAYTTAWDAWKAWLELLPVLAEGRNYHPVFGEELGQYGIELREPASLLACNPQHYPYRAVDIGSMERAKARINAEGLHLVEHLLLRSGKANAPIPTCADPDPCASALGRPAQAAPDPYSFILTVTLPAWPARFRTPANRALLESIIQRETPAHILPRILWLTPRDMCRMETLYGGWIDRLRREGEGDHYCGLFEEEAFIRFLFEAGSEGPIVGSPCDPRQPARGPDPDQNAAWLREINELYCWGRPPAKLQPSEIARIRVLENTRGQRYSENIRAWKEATGAEDLADRIDRFRLNPEPPARVLEELLTAINEAEEGGPADRAAGPRPPLLAATVLAIFLDRIVRKQGERETWAQLAGVLSRCGHRVGHADNFYTDWQPEELRPLAPRMDLAHLRKILKENIHHRP
jgi:hypothetical protein